MHNSTQRIAAAIAVAAMSLSGVASAQSGPMAEPWHERNVGDAYGEATERLGERGGAPLYTRELTSPEHHIDGIYKSMMGPKTSRKFLLGAGEEPELYWITGYKAVVTAPDGVSEASQEFMCHSNLDVDPKRYHTRFPTRLRIAGMRLFTLAQGQSDLDLPEGFGVPMMSNQTLRIVNQSLNHNLTSPDVRLRQRVDVRYVKDRELQKPLRPLIPRGIQGMVLVDGNDGHFNVAPDEVNAEEHGEGCGIGEHVGENHEFSRDRYGRKFSGFWRVPPGEQKNHTLVTSMLALPYDTTLHYAAVHLHPFAEYLELVDLTTGETVFKSSTRQAGDGKIGLSKVEYIESVEGIPLYRSHEYELVSMYNNTTDVDQDSMAVIILYMLAKDLYDFDLRGEAAGESSPLQSQPAASSQGAAG